MINMEQLLHDHLEDDRWYVFPETQADINNMLPAVIIAVAPETLGNGPWSAALVSDVNFNVLAEDFDKCMALAWEFAAELESLPGKGDDAVGWISSVGMTMLPTRVAPIPGTSSGVYQVALAARIVFEQ